MFVGGWGWGGGRGRLDFTILTAVMKVFVCVLLVSVLVDVVGLGCLYLFFSVLFFLY